MKQVEVIKKLTDTYPKLTLEPGNTYYWSPSEKIVHYKPDNVKEESIWALLHESGHALLEHTHYYSDIELLHMELEAWEKAKELSSDFKSPEIDEDHIQDCLDSYRDWLYKRSLCPDCSLAGAQIEPKTYTCIFCHKKWSVSSERFCRPYRKTAK